MSLLPYIFDDQFFRPSRIIPQHFGLVLDADDFLQPSIAPRLLFRSPAGYIRNWQSLASEQDTGSAVNYGKDKFEAHLDVQQFKPDEVSVKVTGDKTVTIEGKHEEKEDEHGQIYRHFIRRYVLPRNYDIGKLESKLSSDGVLTITAPTTDDNAIEHKPIPIKHTGEPAKPIQKKPDDKSSEKKSVEEK